MQSGYQDCTILLTCVNQGECLGGGCKLGSVSPKRGEEAAAPSWSKINCFAACACEAGVVIGSGVHMCSCVQKTSISNVTHFMELL